MVPGEHRLQLDAAALLGMRDVINYEGQAAVELKQLADPGERGSYQARVEHQTPFGIRDSDLVWAAVEDLAAGNPREIVAARFHNAVAALIEDG